VSGLAAMRPRTGEPESAQKDAQRMTAMNPRVETGSVSRIESCVICGGTASEPLFAVPRVPIHPFCPPAGLGLEPGFGSLDIVACSGCGHIYNAGFDPDRVDDLYAATVLTNTPVSDSMIRGLEATADYILAHAPENPAVADVGGGTGVLAMTMARRAREVHLVEPSRVLRPEDFASRGVTLHQSMFPAPSLGERMFDVIVSRQVVEHIPDPLGFLGSIRSRLESGGIAYIECPSAEYIEATRSIVDFHYPHVHYYRRPALETLLARAGFRVIEVIDVKDGHDRGFLLSAAAESLGTPAPSRHSTGLAAGLAERVGLGRQRLGALDGTIALYGANAYSQALLGLYPESARYGVMLDDTPMYEGQCAYGPGIYIPIRRPSREAFAGLAAVVITSYLHDGAIGHKVRDFGFKGPVLTVRAGARAGPEDWPPSLFACA